MASISSVCAKEDFLPRGYEYVANAKEFDTIKEGKDIIIVASSISSCNTCPKVADKRKDGEDAAKDLYRELKDEFTLLYWPRDKYIERKEILQIITKSISSQGAKFPLTTFAFNVETNEVVAEGEVYPDGATRSEQKKSILDFAEKVRAVRKELAEGSKDPEDVASPITVISKQGKTLEVIPLEISREILKYEFEGKEREIELSKITEESQEEVKDYLSE